MQGAHHVQETLKAKAQSKEGPTVFGYSEHVLQGNVSNAKVTGIWEVCPERKRRAVGAWTTASVDSTVVATGHSRSWPPLQEMTGADEDGWLEGRLTSGRSLTRFFQPSR